MNRLGWSGKLRMALVAAAGLLSAGCGGQTAEAAFATDFNCQEAVVDESAADGRYRVTGCGREATYQCLGAGSQRVCVIQTMDEGSTTARRTPRAEPGAGSPKSSAPEVRVEGNGDNAVMKLELVLEGKALLRVTATLKAQADAVELKLVRGESEGAGPCDLDFMINGQVIATPKAVEARKGDMVAHSVQIGREPISQFAGAQKIALRACNKRWALNRDQVQRIREFMDRFEEEVAWKAPARDAATSDQVAPAGD